MEFESFILPGVDPGLFFGPLIALIMVRIAIKKRKIQGVISILVGVSLGIITSIVQTVLQGGYIHPYGLIFYGTLGAIIGSIKEISGIFKALGALIGMIIGYFVVIMTHFGGVLLVIMLGFAGFFILELVKIYYGSKK